MTEPLVTHAAAKAMDDTAAWAHDNVRHINHSKPTPDQCYTALQQSLAHYRRAGLGAPLVQALPATASRADLLLNEAAAQAARGVSHIGWLSGAVRQLCSELDALTNPNDAPAGESWEHIDVRANADLGNAMVRCFYDRDGDLMAVFLAGVELSYDTLRPEVWEALGKSMRDELAVYAEEHNSNAEIDRAGL